jgi:hypothetical protein
VGIDKRTPPHGGSLIDLLEAIRPELPPGLLPKKHNLTSYSDLVTEAKKDWLAARPTKAVS